MSELRTTGAILQATVTITRKATGAVEEYQLTGYLSKDQAVALEAEANSQENPNECHPHRSGS